jgi:tetratricopeptide (TPR) repeat protein
LTTPAKLQPSVHQYNNMAVVNLHNLDNDIIFEILTQCSNLPCLHNLVLTHPILHHVFNSRRRLILRAVFRTQNSLHILPIPSTATIKAADAFITSIDFKNAIDNVALREAFLPGLEQTLPFRWLAALLNCHRKAELLHDALSLAKQTQDRIFLDKTQNLVRKLNFARAIVRTYTAAELIPEAIELQKKTLKSISPRTHEHSIWAKELVAAYQRTGQSELVLQVQLDCWELYRRTVGPGTNVTLSWARSIVNEHQLRGDNQEAIKFHQRVRGSLDPRTPQYIAWSRQLIRMHQRSNQTAEAVAVTEEVWRHLQPDSKGYRAWTGDLGQLYDSAGRPDDAIAVYLAAWTAINNRLARSPNDATWKYHARGAGIALASAYRKHQRFDDATSLEAKCHELTT